MKNFKNFILEKSSLTPLGVPEEVMKEIQINFEIDSKSTWTKMNLKKDIISELKKDEKQFFIQISNKKNIYIFINNHKQYFKQYFKYETEGWGSFRIDDRTDISLTQLSYSIDIKDNIYMLDNSNFKIKEKKQRFIQAQTEKLVKETSDFKIYILKHFNSIIQRIYGNKYSKVMKQISKNISEITPDTSADEILKFLSDNKKLAEAAREFEDARDDEDILRLKRIEEQFNSLTIIDEYLLRFEDAYSDEFNHHLTIKDLINDFGRMYIETAFMYFLYTGKLKKLEIK